MCESYPIEPNAEEYYEEAELERYRRPSQELLNLQYKFQGSERLEFWRNCADAHIIHYDRETSMDDLIEKVIGHIERLEKDMTPLPF